MTTLPSDCPRELAELLARHGAGLDSMWRERSRAYGRAGDLFVRWSGDPVDVAVLAHEAAVRDAVGTGGVLRSPPVLASGPGWLVERAIDGAPVAGVEAVEAVVAAAVALASADLPPAPELRPGPRYRAGLARQRVRSLLRTPIGRDVLAVQRLRRRRELPLVTSHGDFHAKNLLLEDARPWVIDWELLGRRAAGFDLLQLWPELPDRGDRDVLLDATVAVVGERWRAALLELRYALLVQAIVAKLVPFRDDPQPEAGRALLAVLPEVRAAVRA